jgi:hypothetical protein
MEAFKTTYESRPCACGGRHNEIPSIKSKHEATLRHRTWRWERLCEAMLGAMTHAEKRAILRESRTLLNSPRAT